MNPRNALNLASEKQRARPLLKVLIVDSTTHRIQNFTKIMDVAHAPFRPQILQVQNIDEALRAIEEKKFDLILTSELEPLESTAAVVWMADDLSDEIVERGIKAGVTNFLQLQGLTSEQLWSNIKQSIARVKSNSDGLHDSLTNLLNRSGLMHRLEHSLSHAGREQKCVAVLYFDLDHFKPINDTYGHAAGDEVLKEIAQRLRNVIRRSDSAGRIGGDEFVLILESLHRPEELSTFATRLMKSIAQPILYKGHPLHVTSSIGVSVFPMDGANSEDLLGVADMTMYEAKKSGKNQFRFASQSIGQKVRSGFIAEEILAKAVQTKRLQTQMTPIFDLETMEVYGFNAQFHYDEPSVEGLSSNELYNIAGRAGFLRAARNQLLDQIASFTQETKVVLRLTEFDFKSADLRTHLLKRMNDGTLNSQNLVFQVSGASLGSENSDKIDFLKSLEKLGARISLTDFGTEGCSLRTLYHLQFASVEVHRDFLVDMASNPIGTELLSVIKEISQVRGFQLMATDVNAAKDLEIATKNAFNLATGFQLSAPISPNAAKELLKSTTPPRV